MDKMMKMRTELLQDSEDWEEDSDDDIEQYELQDKPVSRNDV